MFLDQLVRLFGGLVEFFIGLMLFAVFMFGVALWSNDFPVAGMFIAGGVTWFVVAARSKR